MELSFINLELWKHQLLNFEDQVWDYSFQLEQNKQLLILAIFNRRNPRSSNLD
jgi:hypothetical protein